MVKVMFWSFAIIIVSPHLTIGQGEACSQYSDFLAKDLLTLVLK
jgi:hypothetical protein